MIGRNVKYLCTAVTMCYTLYLFKNKQLCQQWMAYRHSIDKENTHKKKEKNTKNDHSTITQWRDV